MPVSLVDNMTPIASRARRRAIRAEAKINPDALYPLEQCQAWLGIGRSTWYRWAKVNKTPPVRQVGGILRILGRDFIEFRDKITSSPTAA